MVVTTEQPGVSLMFCKNRLEDAMAVLGVEVGTGVTKV